MRKRHLNMIVGIAMLLGSCAPHLGGAQSHDLRNNIRDQNILIGLFGFSGRDVTVYVDNFPVFQGRVDIHDQVSGLSASFNAGISDGETIRIVSEGFDQSLTVKSRDNIGSIVVDYSHLPHIIPSESAVLLME